MLIDINIFDNLQSCRITTGEDLQLTKNINSIIPYGHTMNVPDDSNDFYIAGTLRKQKHLDTTRINQLNRDHLISVRMFESEILTLQHSGDYRKAMYRIHEKFLYWKKNQLFSECDLLFENLDTDILDLKILITLLMASVQIKPRLSYRSHFYNSVLDRAKRELPDDEVELIFSGLL